MNIFRKLLDTICKNRELEEPKFQIATPTQEPIPKADPEKERRLEEYEDRLRRLDEEKRLLFRENH